MKCIRNRRSRCITISSEKYFLALFLTVKKYYHTEMAHLEMPSLYAAKDSFVLVTPSAVYHYFLFNVKYFVDSR